MSASSLAADGSGHVTDALHGLRSEYPDWGVWRSGTGRWWAYRTGRNPLTIEQIRAGCRLIVQAETLGELRAIIQVETAAAQGVPPSVEAGALRRRAG